MVRALPATTKRGTPPMRIALRLSLGLTLFVGCTCTVQETPDGGTPHLTFSDGPTFDFAGVDVGSTQEHTFTLTNTGAATADGLSLTAGGVFAVKSGSDRHGTARRGGER